MNHIIKVMQFYKILRENDIYAVNYIFDYTKSIEYQINYKKISIEKLHFLIQHKTYENSNCKFCFNSIYDNLFYIPLQLSNRYFYLKQAKIQIFDKHFEINDFVHSSFPFSNDTFIQMNEFIKLFPSFMIIYYESSHHHFEAGLIDSPILKQDASICFEDIYLVDWYITTFLIKDNELSNVINQFNFLTEKYKTATPITIFFKRNNKYYLYVILKNSSSTLTDYEAMGYFFLTETPQSLNQEFVYAINKLKNGRI